MIVETRCTLPPAIVGLTKYSGWYATRAYGWMDHFTDDRQTALGAGIILAGIDVLLVDGMTKS